jgi:hypothetical protein
LTVLPLPQSLEFSSSTNSRGVEAGDAGALVGVDVDGADVTVGVGSGVTGAGCGTSAPVTTHVVPATAHDVGASDPGESRLPTRPTFAVDPGASDFDQFGPATLKPVGVAV